MVGRNDRTIVDALEAVGSVMAQVNQNQNGGADGILGLGKFQRNNPHTFKGIYDLEGAQTWL